MRNVLLVLPLTVGFAASEMVQKQDEGALAAKVAQQMQNGAKLVGLSLVVHAE